MSAGVPVMPNYRPMQFGDIDSVLALGRSSLTYIDLATGDSDPHDYNSLYVSSDLTFAELDPTDPASPVALNFVAETETGIAGFLLAYEHFVGIPVHPICVIQAIVVDPDYHGQGIGPQLIRHLQNKCKQKDITVMRILVPQQNTPLKHYLGSLGFHQSHVINFDKPTWD